MRIVRPVAVGFLAVKTNIVTTSRSASVPDPSKSRRKTALALAALAFVVYNLNLRPIEAGDTLPARYLPLAIWRTGTLHLDSFVKEMNAGQAPIWWTIRLRGHYLSVYPVVAPLLVTPLYAPAAIYLARSGWDSGKVTFTSGAMEKLSASLIAAASVAVMYLVLLGVASRRGALILTVAYALGTNTWVTGSQALWQHGMGELLLAIVLYAAPRSEARVRWAAVAGIGCVLMGANRPADSLMAAAVGAWFLRPATWKPFLAAAVPLGTAILACNRIVFGSIAGGYGRLPGGVFFRKTAVLEGVAGLLVSPAKGLFVFSPFLVLLLAASPRRFQGPGRKRLAFLLLLGLALQLALYGKTDWGSAFGPRYLSGSLPAMIWLIAPVVDALKRPLRFALLGTIFFAIGMQTAGAFYYPSSVAEAVYKSEPWTLWHPLYNTVLRDLRTGPILPGVIRRIRWGHP